MGDLIGVTPEDIGKRLPRPLEALERERVAVLIEDAVEIIELEFARRGRVLGEELRSVPWLPAAVRRVVRQMVSAPVLVGVNVGVRSVSSTTGQVSDSVTFADVEHVDWGGVTLTDELAAYLGLVDGAPSGCFPQPGRWPEVPL